MKRLVSILLALVVCGTLVAGAWANPNSMTIVSDTSVDAYGPLDHYASLDSGEWGAAEYAKASFVHSAWGPPKPSSIDGATWISTDYCPEDAVHDSWRKFAKSFELCQGAYNISGFLQVNSDNAEEAYLNSTLLGTDGEVQGTASDNQEWSTVKTYPINPKPGENTLEFISRNYALNNGVCETNPAALTFKAEITYSCPIQVDIDIKPGSDPSCFNNDGNGVIPVAILGSADFDVTQIDAGTVQLEGLAVAARGKANKLLAAYEDVNTDGFTDLVIKIEDVDGTFTQGSGTATLTGNLLDGTSILGTGDICITQP
jgi:hypothetical protein